MSSELIIFISSLLCRPFSFFRQGLIGRNRLIEGDSVDMAKRIVKISAVGLTCLPIFSGLCFGRPQEKEQAVKEILESLRKQ